MKHYLYTAVNARSCEPLTKREQLRLRAHINSYAVIPGGFPTKRTARSQCLLSTFSESTETDEAESGGSVWCTATQGTYKSPSRISRASVRQASAVLSH